ncbi:MAG: DUF2244 domain-containing protein [bacterium]
MVSTQYFSATSAAQNGGYVGQIVIRPNNSMGWRTTRYFLASLMFISFTMATVFLWQGYWLILPFTMLEMSFLLACFYYLIRRNQTQEVVWFAVDQVVMEVGRNAPEIRHEWQRFFTKVLVEAPRHPWYPSRVAFRYRDKEYEIGKYLNSEDKQMLIRELKRMVAAADARQHQHPAH